MLSLVTDETLNHIRNWFEAYAQQFMATVPTAESRRAMMGLKLAHSRRVAAEARSLATELGWDTGRHRFREKRTMGKGQNYSPLRSANDNISQKLKRFSAVAFFATVAVHGKIQQP